MCSGKSRTSSLERTVAPSFTLTMSIVMCQQDGSASQLPCYKYLNVLDDSTLRRPRARDMSRVREGHRFEMSRDIVTVSAAESGWGVVGEVCV